MSRDTKQEHIQASRECEDRRREEAEMLGRLFPNPMRVEDITFSRLGISHISKVPEVQRDGPETKRG